MPDAPIILLVDDLAENLLALEATLRRDDAVVVRARSGREALERLLVDEVAVAIIDVQMPEMDGFELAELMRGTERTREVPIIFVTAGLHDRSRIFKGYDAGGVDFLHKPLDPRVLRGKVDVFLKLHRQRQLLAEQLRDLRRADEELREADRRKTTFLSLLSHELRNPLTPIRNSLYILRNAPPGGEEARRAQAVMERQVTHLTRIVDDLLDVTRITRGAIDLRREPLDLVELVRRGTEDHRASFTGSGLDLAVTTPAEPVWADADGTRLAQALGNLLANALKFTPRGGRVTVTLAVDAEEATIRVADTGVGIDPAVRAHVFELFTQAEQTLARSRGGLGIGLALVKSLIELHGGRVEVASEGAGRGATFTLHLPRRDVAPRPAAPAPDRRTARRRRVLIVEDNADCADGLRQVLELMGHEVHVGRDGAEGVTLASRVVPDVVVCDIGLPGMNGYEVARAVRRLVPDAVLVALSGYALPDDRRRAREAGFTHHLAKPPRLDELEQLLARR